jgi:hypothetical protein
MFFQTGGLSMLNQFLWLKKMLLFTDVGGKHFENERNQFYILFVQ